MTTVMIGRKRIDNHINSPCLLHRYQPYPWQRAEVDGHNMVLGYGNYQKRNGRMEAQEWLISLATLSSFSRL